TGVSGEIDITVRGGDVTKPQVVGWMTNYEQRLLAHYGYLETGGCARATVCPALSLPGLFCSSAQAGNCSSSLTQSSIQSLLAVGLVLLAVFRRAEGALVPLVPIALATGWSALILFATGIPLNPMSATLGVLVVAISTEFSVLLSERFHEERAAGHELWEALE